MNFLFYDLETSGTHPGSDRIMQFAAQRTTLALEPIDDPITFYVKLGADVLPSPTACLVTGLSPQRVNARGLDEWQAMARIRGLLEEPETCLVGYNNLRFDDAFLRFSFYRNLFDPYAHEWQGNNSRWDVIDLVRAMRALRPDGIEWPVTEEGVPIFRLESLSAANGIVHEDAHDATSDVMATIGLARLIREAQPKLWEFAFERRDKVSARSALLPLGQKLSLHVSRMFPNARLCAAPVTSLAIHPEIDSRIIVVDLSRDIDALIDEPVDTLRERLFAPDSDDRPPLKEVVLNRCPFLAPISVVDASTEERLGFSLAEVRDRFLRLQATPNLAEKISAVYARDRGEFDHADAELALYDGFVPDVDRQGMAVIRDAIEADDPWPEVYFIDPRVRVLAERLKAKLRPDELGYDEAARWETHVGECRDFGFASRPSAEDYLREIANLAENADDARLRALEVLAAYIR